MKKILLLVLIAAVLITAVVLTGCNNGQSVINSIELYTQPVTVYVQNQPFNLSGAQLLVKYDNSTERYVTITEDMISGYDNSLLGQQFLTITFEGKIISLPVTIVSPELVSIDINTLPNKTSYKQGQLLDISGCSINVNYVGGAKQVISVTKDMCDLSVVDMDEVGTQVVTVSYTINNVTRTATFNISIVAKILQSIQITQNPTKEIYYVGETLDLSGGEIFMAYNNGYPERLDLNKLYNNGNGNLVVQWDNTTTTSRSVVNLTYNYEDPTSETGEIRVFTSSFDVTVTQRDISYVETLNTSSQSGYKVQLIGKDLDLSGLILRVTYNNGTSEIINISNGTETDSDITKIAVSGYNNDYSGIGYQAITIAFRYSGVLLKNTYELGINLYNREESGIRLILPQGTIYQDGIPCFYQDTPINIFADPANDIIGWRYVILYNNGTESDTQYDLVSSMLSTSAITNGMQIAEVGSHNWSLRFKQIANIPFNFKVIAKQITSASISLATGYKTYFGFDLNMQGVMLNLAYNNGTQEQVYATASMVKQYSADILGEQTIILNYKNKYTAEAGIDISGIVTLVKKVKDNYSIGFNSLPKTSYIRDEKLSLAGAKINIQYDEGGLATTEVLDVAALKNDWVKLSVPLIAGATTFRNSDGWTLTTTNISNDWKFTEISTVQVFLSYEGLTSFGNGAGFAVTVTDPISSIMLIGYIEDVYAGQELDLAGQQIRINFASGRYETANITKEMTNYKPRDISVGARNITITYKDPATQDLFTTDFSIQVMPKALRSIEVISPPYKTEYLYSTGSTGESLDFAGLKLMFNYNNGSADIITINDDNLADFRIDNFATDFETEALPIYIIYAGDIYIENPSEDVLATFTISVRDVVVKGLKWVGAAAWPVVTSDEGKDFNMIAAITDYSIEVEYSDGNFDVLTVAAFANRLNVVGYNRNTAIRQNISLAYTENSLISLKLEVNVTPRTLESIILMATRELEVIENNDIDLTEYKLTLNYSNFTQEIVSIEKAHIQKSALNPDGYDKNDTRIGLRNVTIMYTQNGVRRYFTTVLTVRAKQLISIGINTLPKIKYIEGEELDLNGGKVALYYDNGSQEELPMTDATTSSFFINRNKFDNNEFSGIAKLQTIYVVYVFAGTEFQTHFDIIMQDRKYPSVVFDSQNKYDFVYGDKQAPSFTIHGYSDFYQEEANMVFNSAKLAHVTVKYINVNEYNNQDPAKDYTILPSEAGNYYIVVSYDANPSGYSVDSVHNSLIYISPRNLVITKRVVYVAISGVEKIYGTTNPNYHISIMSEEKYRNPSIVGDIPFAYNDDFFSTRFIKMVGDQSYCYDKDGNLVKSFLIQCTDRSGVPIDINTGAGSYQLSISLGTSYSDNYQILFVDNYFAIKPRDVLVTPMPITLEYGDRNLAYRYTVEARAGDPASGLYGTDTLSGSLSRAESNNFNVGKYALTKGTLANANYNIIFINDTVSNGGANGVYLTITKRNLYIKVNNKIITYGDPVPSLTSTDITLYRDDVCTITAGALASGDTLALLLGATGALSFTHGITPLSNVGEYGVAVAITGATTGSVITNYNISYIMGQIKIRQKAITVTAAAASKIYGDADPVLSYTVTGSLPSGTLQGSITRQAGEYIGTYAILVGTLASTNPNYSINFVGANFVITSKVLVARISSQNLTKVFDGKVPAAPAFTVYQIVNGQELPVGSSVDTSFISVKIVDASRNSGSYNLSISNSNSNYTVSFPTGVSYKYVIEKRSVGVQIIIPQDLQYKGKEYVFDAYVPDNQIQRFYNSDGSVMVDENNNELKDSITVVLQYTTGSKAIFVGDYEIYVSALSSLNDNYKVDGIISETFSITPRELVVTINDTTLSYDNTIEREYTNQIASIKAADYTVSNRIDGSSDIVNFSIKVVSYEHNLDNAKNVIFNTDGTVGSYDIVIVQPSNQNYTVRLAQAYKYKITPKNAKITIADNFLTKKYNGEAPAITDFSKVSTLAKASVVFTFSRDTNDGRPLGDVGVYNVSAKSIDPNHTVYLAKTYQYTIAPSTVTISLKSDSKSYDGTTITLLYSGLNVGSFKGITPVIRSFAAEPIYSGGNIVGYKDVADVFADFKLVMGQMRTKFSKNIEKVNNIIFTDISLAILRTNETITTLQEAQNYLIEYSWVIQTTGRFDTAITSLNLARSYLNAISAGASTSENDNNLYLAKQKINEAYNIIEAENTYIAFLFRPSTASGANEQAINAGSYTFTMHQNDFNKEYTYNSSQYTYRINPKEVYLGVNTYSKVYGTITANPVLGSPDYYSYETKVLIENERVPMTLPNFDPEFARTNPTNFNVGAYQISYVRNDQLDNNYVIVEDRSNYTWLFSITPATITLRIDDTGYDGDAVYYGTRISNAIVNKWSYVSGLSDADAAAATVGGQISKEYLSTYIINVYNVNYSARKRMGSQFGDDVISNVNAKPSAGEYKVDATGFTSSNYNFVIESGNLKISKADIFINTDYDGNVTRTYGEALILTFGGLKYDDYITVSYNYQTSSYTYNLGLGEDGGSFTMPYLKYNQSQYPTNQYPANFNPYAFTAPATNEGNYPIYFDWLQTQSDLLNNYNMTGVYNGGNNISYGMLVLRANLYITTFDADKPTNSTPTSIYGEIPNIRYEYSGFKNGETQTSLGFANPDQSSLKNRNVSDSQQLTLEDIKFSVAALNVLSNYSVIMDPNAKLIITKRTLYVHFNKTISTQYSASLSITPYVTKVADDTMTFNVISGLYGYWDIAFANKPLVGGTANPKAGLANGQNPEDIFQRYDEEEGVLTRDGDGLPATTYLFYGDMYRHSIVSGSNIGEGQTIRLNGLVFATASENYAVVYDETPLNIYGKLNSFIMDTDYIVISGDTINNLSVKAVFEDGTTRNYTITQLKALSGVSVTTTPATLPAANKNTDISIGFNRTYNLTGFTTRSIVIEGEIYEIKAGAEYQDSFSNGQISSTVATRVFQKTPPEPTANTITLAGYSYRSMRDATGYTSGNLLWLSSANPGSYDYVDTALRMLPTEAAHGFELYFSGGVTAGTSSLLLRGNGNGSYQIVNGGSTYGVDLGSINMFDGFTHSISIYFNKLHSMVYLFVDGYACGAINIGSFIFDSTESSRQSIGFYGTQAWVRHFVTGYKGYYDNIATHVVTTANLPLTYYLAESTEKVLALESILSASGVEGYNPQYAVTYKVNGQVIVSSTYAFAQGSHLVEMIIEDNGTRVDNHAVTVYVTYESQTAAATEITGGASTLLNSNITQSNPLTIRSYTPNGANNDLIDNVLQEFHTYKFDASSNSYTSLAMSLNMRVAKMASDPTKYRVTPNAKSFIALWGSDNLYAPGYLASSPAGYYGLGLSFEYNPTNNSQTTRLNVAFSNTQMYENISGIDWHSNTVHTVKLYVDNATSRIKFAIYSGNTMVYSTILQAGYTMVGGTITAQNMLSLMTATHKVSVISADTVINIKRLQYNPENKTVNDYLVNDVFTQSGTNVNINGNSDVYIADNFGLHSVSRLGESSVKFKFHESAVASNVNFKFLVAATDLNYATAKAVYLEYIGSEQNLYFYFVDGATYKKQLLYTGNLIDGQVHTIVAKLSPTRYEAQAEDNLNGLLSTRADVTPKSVYYNVWNIYIDGQSEVGIMPYYNSANYWIRENGGSSSGVVPPSSGDVFMDSYIYCGLRLTSSPIYLYALESRAKSTSEYLR